MLQPVLAALGHPQGLPAAQLAARVGADRRMLDGLSAAGYSLAHGLAIYLAVTLTISSPVIFYYCTRGAYTEPTEHWEPARKQKAA